MNFTFLGSSSFLRSSASFVLFSFFRGQFLLYRKPLHQKICKTLGRNNVHILVEGSLIHIFVKYCSLCVPALTVKLVWTTRHLFAFFSLNKLFSFNYRIQKDSPVYGLLVPLPGFLVIVWGFSETKCLLKKNELYWKTSENLDFVFLKNV